MARVPTAGIEGVGELPLPALVSRLIDDAREVAHAEVAVYKAKAAERAQAYKGAVVFFAIAGVLVLEALGALLVGLILTLATLVGPGWATLIVVGIVFALAGLLAFIGKGRLAPVPGATK
ncbi:phage holin family protein [uncultured Sphingomonas sp.]|uniref:phage holin family protein n=1 Tax=uncultured Sphingomonas sp. TaxID=158754 RepID=UPI0035C943A0